MTVRVDVRLSTVNLTGSRQLLDSQFSLKRRPEGLEAFHPLRRFCKLLCELFCAAHHELLCAAPRRAPLRAPRCSSATFSAQFFLRSSSASSCDSDPFLFGSWSSSAANEPKFASGQMLQNQLRRKASPHLLIIQALSSAPQGRRSHLPPEDDLS